MALNPQSSPLPLTPPPPPSDSSLAEITVPPPAALPPSAPPPAPSSISPTTSDTDPDQLPSPYYHDHDSPPKPAPLPPFRLPPPSSTPEHFRDIAFLGPLTLHRLFVTLYLVALILAIYYLQNLIWPPTRSVDDNSRLWIASPYIALIWLVSLPSALLSLVGNLLFRYNVHLDKVPPTTHNVAFRIVSRGTNRTVLLQTIARIRLEMARNPMFPYLIEVVTDAECFHPPPDPDLVHLRVPPDYTTPHRTLFKARALHYACQHSLMPPNTWIVHLDEETQPTSSGLKGIAAFVARCEETADLTRIGQGCLLYNRAFEKHPFLTLADMRRTGDDFGHFYLQHRLGVTLFGLHGAFIVCRHDAEAAIGFDLGPAGSITEDAWWILLAMKRGYRTAWVDGYLEEQSTQSIMDFLKQRRRWFYGLVKVSLHCPVDLKYRLFVFFNTVSWVIIPILLPFQIGYMILLYIYDLPVTLPVRLLTNFIVAISALVYLSGLVCNMREHKMKFWKTPFWILAMIVSLPICFFLEVTGVIMAFFAGCTENGKGFHVVQKSANSNKDSATDDDGDKSTETDEEFKRQEEGTPVPV